jgi:tRNA-5-taurinomethyluridine 2-sulfurtransferase
MQEQLGQWPGPIIEEETNKVVALHEGFWFYTIGQRSGLDLGHLPNGPWYGTSACTPLALTSPTATS